MTSSSPLTPRPQDAVPGHDAKSGGGALHHAAAHPGERHLIERGYVPVRQLTGKVVGVWGDAHIRLHDGDVRPLRVGDVVRKGDVVLTSQDGIVQIEGAHAKALLATGNDDVERIISQVGQGDADVVPAAGPNGGAAGSLGEGLRVGRDSESVTAAGLPSASPSATIPTATPRDQATPPLASPPVANPDSESTASNTPVRFDPRVNDTSTTVITIIAVAGHPIDRDTPVTLPQGTVTMNPDGTLTFTPNAGQSGNVTFTYTESNGSSSTSTATVTVAVGEPADHQPVAVADTFSGAQDTAITGSLAGNDTPSADGGNVWTLTSGAAHGTVTVNADGSFSYAPASHYSGPDAFTYTITDADGSTSTAQVTLQVTPVNQAPVAQDDSGAASFGQPVTIAVLANDSDADGNALSITAVGGQPIATGTPVTLVGSGGAPEGTVTLNADGTLTFAPAAGFSGPVDFPYTVSDGTSTSTATVHVVIAADQPPVATPDTFTVVEDTALTIAPLANDTDPEGDALTITAINGTPIDAAHPVAVPNGVVGLNADGTLSFTPVANYNGPSTFTYSVSDGHGGSSTATINVDVTPVNDAPIAHADTYNGTEGTPLTFSPALTANDTDVDGDALTVTQINGATLDAAHPVTVSNGVISMDAGGILTFTPDANYSGSTSFQYTVSDSQGGTSTATATVNVAPVNHAPVANTDTYNATEDTPLVIAPALTANDTDLDGDTLTVSQINGAAIDPTHAVTVSNGVVSMDASGALTFTPNANYNGTTSFQYTVSDGHGGTSTATATVNVAPVNDAPVANNESYNGTEDTPLVIAPALTANDTDVDGDSLTVTQIDGHAIAPGGSVAVTNGTVSMDASGVVTFTPNANYNGTTSFTYQVDDGHGGTSTATATVNVAPVNDAPVAVADTYNINEDTPLVLSGAAGSATHALTSNDTDVDGDTLTVTQINGTAITAGGSVVVSNGVVSMDAAGVVTFTPSANYNGTTSFNYTVSDGHGGTSAATATVVVAPVNDAPVAVPDSYKIDEDTTLVLNGAAGSATHALTSNDTDVDGDTLTVTQINGTAITAGGSVAVANGVVSMDAAGVVTFTPSANYNGTTSFTYTVDDGHGGTSTATATVNVAPVNDAPVAVADTYNINEDSPLVLSGVAGSATHALTSNDTDVDGDTLTVTQINGTAITAGGSVAVSNGVVSMDAAGVVTFTPSANYNGTTSFTYQVDDGHGGTSTATATVNVAPVNDAPVAVADTYTVNEDTPLVLNGAAGSATHALTSNDTDVDGDTLTVTQINGTAITAGGSVAVSNGVVSMDAAGVVTFTPSANYNGTTSFTYQVDDGHGGTSTATATVNVASVNDAPVAVADTYTVNEDTPLVLNGAAGSATHALTSNDIDVDGDTLTVTQINGTAITAGGSVAVANGVVSMSATGIVSFTPTANYNGTTSFNYTVDDGHGGTSTATATVNVAPVNDAPVAVADTYNINEDTPLVLSGAAGSATHALTSNDTDVDGDTLTVTQINGTAITAGGSVAVANGVVSMSATGVITFTPTLNYNGTTTFTYTVDDGHGGTSTATATVNVAPVNDAPVAVADTYNINEDTPLVLSGAAGSATHALTSNDTDVDGDTLTVTQINGTAITAGGSVVVSNGVVSMDAAGVVTFTPSANYNGTTSFNYTVSDGHGGTSAATATVVVAPVNDAPVAVADSYKIDEDTTLVLNGAAGSATHALTSNDTDVDGDTLTVTQIDGHAIAPGGSVVVANGTVSMDAAGVVTFTPTANYNGTTTFTYAVDDGHGGTSTATATVNVAPVNDAPVAIADTYTVNEDTPLVLSGAAGSATHALTSNDTDVDGDTLTVTQINGTAITAGGSVAVANGTVSMDASGVVTFTPSANYNGTTSFSYQVDDGHGGTSTATATINVAPVNDAPVAVADTYNINEDTPLVLSGAAGSATHALTSNDTDVDGDTLTVTQINGTAITAGGSIAVSNGTVSMDAAGVVTFTPSANYNGTTSFNYTVSDGHGGTSTATATVNVAPVNDAPVAVADTYTVNEDTPLVLSGAAGSATHALTSNDTDVDGDTLTVTQINGTAITAGGSIAVSNGTVSMDAAGVVTFTPSANYNGTTSFNYTVSDGHGGTSTATATVNVAPVNDAPVAVADAYTVNEDTPLVLSGAAGSATHALTSNDTDVDSDTLTVTQINGTSIGAGGSVAVSNGVVSMDAAGVVTFTPSANYNGTTSFNYTVDDGHGGTSAASATVVVAPVNDAPVAVADTYHISEDTPLVLNGAAATGTHALTSNDTDVDGDAVAVTQIDGQAISPGGSVAVANGTVSMDAAGVVTFTPTALFSGVTSFTYTISDGHGGTSSTTATIDVSAVNHAPVAAPDTYTVDEDTPLVLSGAAGSATHALTSNDADVDGDTLTVTQINGTAIAAGGSVAVSNGTVSMDAAGVVTFTPSANYNGTTSFTYTVDDGHGGTATATATVNVAPVNDAPVAVADTYTVNEDTPLVLNGAAGSATHALTSNDTDVDGDTLTVTQINGTAITAGGSVAVSNGVVSMDAAGVVTFTPTANYNGTTSFTYQVDDGHGGTSTATATVNVAPVNDAPVAVADTYTVNEDTPLVLNGAAGSATHALTSNDTDVDGDTLTVTQINGTAITAGGSVAVSNGVVSMDAAGVVTFTPSANYNGTTSFTYQVDDGHGGTSTATATVNVAPVNDAPVAVADTYTVNEDTPLVLNGAAGSATHALTSNDTDVDGDTLTVTQINGTAITAGGSVVVSNGVVSMDAAGVVTFTPSTNYNGTTSFNYTVSDGHGGTSTATATVNVAPVNDAPVAVVDTYNINEDTPLVLNGAAGSATHTLTSNDTDVDGDTLTVTQINGTAITAGGSVVVSNGVVSMDAAGVVTFTPSANYNGTTSFTYQVDDGHGGTSTATATVNVAPVNDAPVAVADTYNINEDTPLVLSGAAGSATHALTSNDTDVDGDTLTVTQINGTAITAGGSVVVSNGVVSMDAAGVVTFTPSTNYNGTTSFNYTVSDGHGGTSTATATVNVAPVNDAPVAVVDTYNINEDTPLVLNGAAGSATHTLTSNDTDVDGDTLTVTQINGTAITAGGSVVVSNGVVSMDAAGVVTFTPSANYNGTTSFTYQVDDGHGGTSTATATVNVAPVNDAPVAVVDTYNINEDTPLVLNGAAGSATHTLTSNDTDVDGDTLTVTQINGTAITAGGSVVVSNGVVSMDAAGVVTFTPSANYNGTTSFTYQVDDGHGGTSTATATVNVAPVNDAPVAVADTYNINEDTPLVLSGAAGSATHALTSNDTDVDGDTLTVTQINGTAITAGGSVVVSNGVVSMDAAGVVTFTPSTNYNGTTSFNYTVSDGHGGTSTATATVNVAPVNDAPVAVVDTYNINEDTPLVLNGTAGSATHTLTSNDTDVDGDALTVTQINGTAIAAGGSVAVSNGTVSMDAAGVVTFTPSANYNGTTSFTYQVDDGHGGTSTATATVNVAPVNDAPVAVADSYKIDEDTTLVLNGAAGSATHALTSNDTDVDGDTLTVTQIDGHAIAPGGSVVVANGTVSMDATAVVTFTPTANYNGTTSFSYQVDDGHGGTSTATATINVAPVNDAPVAVADTYNINEDTPLVLSGVAGSATHALTSNDTDVDGDALTVTQINGTAIAAGGSVAVSNGTVSMDAAGVVTFTPSANYNGTTSFTYQVDDGHGGTATATATVNVAPVNDAPIAIADTYTVNEDTPLVLSGAAGSATHALTSNDTDLDGDTLTVTQINGTAITAGGSVAVANGTVSMDAAGVVTFTPSANYNGTTSFTYTVDDGHGGTSTATATVNVAPVNDAPVAVADTYNINEDTPLVLSGAAGSATHALTSNDTDVDGDTLTVTQINGTAITAGGSVAVSNGVVSMDAAGVVTFTPSANYNGTTSFTYQVDDGHGGTSTATATVNVAPVNDAPVAVADTYNINEDTPLVLSGAAGSATHALTSNDTDVDGDTLTVTQINGTAITAGGSVVVSNGVVSMDAAGVVTFTPSANYNGTTSFNYTVSDGHGGTSTATATVNVAPVNDAPVAVADTYNINEDTPLVLSGAAGSATHALTSNDTDVDGDTLTVTQINGTAITAGGSVAVANGVVSMSATGVITFTPTLNYNGTTTFTYAVDDGHGGTSTATATVNVAPVNDAPVAIADTYTVNEDTPLVLSGAAGSATHALTSNDTDVDGDTLTVTQINGTSIAAGGSIAVSNGTVSMDAAGVVTFTPSANYNGTTSFNYTVSDGHGGTSAATATVVVAPVNDAPVAVADTYNVNEDTPLVLNGASGSATHALTSNDTDVDGDTLTVTQINGTAITAGGSVAVANGTVSMDASGVVTFTPSANYNGTTSFSYQVDDGHGGTSTATATINVAPVNDAPVAVADTYNINEDTPLVLSGAAGSATHALTSNDTDVDGDTLTVTQINGTAIAAGGSVAVSNGAVSMSASGVITFTPTLNYNGTTTFTYTVDDGHGGTSTATAAVVVAPVNDAPVAVADSYKIDEDTPLVLNGAAGSATHALTSNDTDVDGDTLTVTQINGTAITAGGSVAVSNGVVSMDAAGVVTFTPSANYNGTTSFNYTVSDGHGGTSAATATVNVAPVNDAPVAVADTYNINEDTPLVLSGAAGSATHALTSNDTDVDGDTLTVTQINGTAITAGGSVVVSNGVVSMDAAGVVTFTPSANYNGTTSFNYTVSDGHGGTSAATATVVVAPVNDAPVAVADTYNINEDTPLVLSGAAGSATHALTSNDTDVDGDTLTVTQINGTAITAGGSVVVSNGVVSMDAAGVVTFTPSANYNGTTSFNYTVSDGHGGTSAATATVVVAPVNDAPVAVADTYNINEDTPLVLSGAAGSATHALTSNDTDVDGDTLTVTQINGTAITAGGSVAVANGVVSMSATGIVSFTPMANYNGTTSFTYTIDDGHGGTSTATATVNVAPVNDAPVAVADTYNINEDTPLVLSGAAGSATHALTSNDTDVDGDTLTVTQINGTAITAGGSVAVANGVVSMSATGIVSFTPTANYNGTTSFNYTVDDGHGGTSTATATVNVAPVNDAPVAVADTYNINEDTPLVLSGAAGSATHALTSNDTDVDGDTLTVTQINGTAITAGGSVAVANGVVSMSATGIVSFTPTANYNGTTSFNYTVDDGHGGTSTATATVNVAPVNDAPVAVADTYTVNEDTPLVLSGAAGSATHALTSNDTDVDGDTLTVTQINGTSIAAGGSVAVANGTVSMSATGVITFTPTANYNGTTSFSYQVDDGHGGTSTATATINVAPVNDAPVAVADTYNINEDTPLVLSGVAGSATHALTSNDTDVDGDALTVTQINGTAIAAGGSVTVANGVVSMSATGVVSFTPTANYNGTTSFTYTVDDGHGGTSTATATVNVAPVNDAPVAVADTYNINEDTPLVLSGVAGSATHALTSNDTDVDGDTLTVTQINGTAITAGGSVAVANGVVSMSATGIVSFTPTANYNGMTSFTYTIDDGHGGTSTATATVNVAPVNDAPVAVADTYNINEDTPLVLSGAAGSATHALTSNDTDVDGDTLTVTQINGTAITAGGSVAVSNGTVSMSATGVITFTPTLNYNGTTTFNYTVSDGHGGTATATATVNVAPVNDAPVAVADTYNINEDTPLVLSGAAGSATHALTSNDTDVDGDTLTVTQINGTSIAAGGSVAVANGTVSMSATGVVTFTPTLNYNGTTTFNYAVSDGHGGTSTATATVNVAPVNDAPVAVADSYNTNEDTPLVLSGAAGSATHALTSNDTDVDGDALTVTQINGTAIAAGGSVTVANGVVSMSATGVITFTPTLNYNGTTSFAYTVDDGHGGTSTATATVAVAPVNDAPIAVDDTYSSTRGVTLTLNGTAASANHALTSNDTDADGDTLTVTKINGTAIAAGGSVTVSNGVVSMSAAGVLSFAPTSSEFTGQTSFTYTISDGNGGTSTATSTINVVAGNNAPTANADVYAATENTLLVLNGAAGAANHGLTTNDTDPNGDALTVTQINGATLDATHSVAVTSGGNAAGTLVMDANGMISFNPASNFTGSVSFNYTISDGHGGTATSTATINVAAGTDDPTVTAAGVGRWLFNEGSGTATTDAYNAYTGTLTDLNPSAGGTAPTWVTGHNGTAGTALNFDGKGGVVSVPAGDTAALTGTSSLSVWFKTTQTGNAIGWSSPSIIGSESAGDGNDIQWGTLNNTGRIGLDVGNSTGVYSANAVNDGAWHDLTITRTVNANGSSSVSIYIDGALSNSGTIAADSTIPNGITTNQLAGFGYTNGWSTSSGDTLVGDVYFKGALDDARIYNHVLTADQAKAIYTVENGYETQAVANDGDAIKLAVTDTHATALHVIGVENGMTLTDGTHSITATSNTQVIDITGWTLSSLQLTNVGTGSANLEFDAINVNGSQSEDTSSYLSVVNGTSLVGGTVGNDTLTASSNSAAFISGGVGDDSITGGTGHDRLLGGAGNDTISGGGGADLIVGGTGSDTLTGGAGSDVFRWEFGDQGTAGTPSVDTITDFSSTASNKDVLDMRDFLGGANHTGTTPGNIASFLHFDHSGADTIIHVSTTGGFASGYSSAVENETIVLKGVDLTANGTQTDAQIITQLLTNGQLHLG